MYLPTLTELREAARPPRVHGNGFIQVDLNDEGTRRLHVWDHDVPRQKVATPIHEHVFDMRSQVIRGTLIHTEYDAFDDIDGTHKVYYAEQEPDSQNTVLKNSGRMLTLVDHQRLVLGEGSIYFFAQYRLHETQHIGPTATVMEKIGDGLSYGRPCVLVPMGEEPDNEFRRDNHDVRWLWEIIARVL